MKQLFRASLSNPDNSAKKQHEYVAHLKTMTDSQLEDETTKMVYLSAWAGNNPRSCFHWQCDACHAECSLRDDKGLYKRAFEAAREQAGL